MSRKVLWIGAAAGLLAVCASIMMRQERVPEGEFRIEGELTGVPDSTVLSLYRVDGNLLKPMQADTVIDGRFSFRDTITTDPRCLALMGRGEGFPPTWLDVWVGSGTVVHIKGEGKGLRTWFVESRLPEHFSIGIHPKNIDPECIERDLAIMDRVLAENRSGGVVAVGECGLDKFSLVDLETQEKVFVAQIQMALKYDLPMVIHSVRSWQEIIRVKKQYARKQTWVVHGFRSSIEAAESLIRHNILLSFGEAVTEEQSKARAVIGELNYDSFFLETDESTMPIEYIYKVAAHLCDCEVEYLCDRIQENFQRVFRK